MRNAWNPLVDPHNKLATKGFARIPWTLRYLLNRALTYREASVYLQVAMHCGKDETYHWGLEKLSLCLGWKRINALYACLNKLVDAGFLIKAKQKYPGARKYMINIYQRPTVGHTLTKLCEQGYVGAGKGITDEEFKEACQLYETKEKPLEPTPHQFNASPRKEARRIAVRKEPSRSA